MNMYSGRGTPHSEDKIQVQDSGQTATPFPRPLSQYMSADVAARLINPSSPRTVAIMDQEILSVNSIIKSLHVLRILKSQMRNERTPVSRLPPEILADIFIQSLNYNNSQDNDGSQTKKLDPRLILGQVCSAWRSVAWGLPMLWTTVHCRVSHPKKSEKLADLLFQWLLRTRDLPVSVRIDFEDEETWQKLTNAPTNILDVLMPFCKTWKALHLVLPESWYRLLNVLNSSRLVFLEEINIRPLSPPEDDYFNLDGFLGAPNLRSISYHSYALRLLDFTWSNLVHGSFGGPSLDEIALLLSRCANLISCHISDPILGEQANFVSQVFHRCLKELHIASHTAIADPELAFNILDLLTVPQLQNISLTLPLNSPDPLTRISQLIERSRCPLKAVEIYGLQIDDERIVDFLADSPAVHLHNG